MLGGEKVSALIECPLISTLMFNAGILLTVQHLRSHPVRVAHHRVALFAVDATEDPLLVGGLIRRGLLHLVLHDEPGQTEVRHHHRVVLMSKEP